MILNNLILGTVVKLIVQILILRITGQRSAFDSCPVMGFGVERFNNTELANNSENNR
jgi:hypothetical protein